MLSLGPLELERRSFVHGRRVVLAPSHDPLNNLNVYTVSVCRKLKAFRLNTLEQGC